MNSGRLVKPSEKLKTKHYLTLWIVFITMIFPYVFLGFIPGAGWLYVGIYLSCCALGILIAYLLIPPYYNSISYEFGDQEIIVRKGIITKVENVVPYRMVTNVSLKRGVLDRWLGLGTLDIHTAGFSQQTTPEAKLSGLVDHEKIHQELTTALRRFRGEAGPAVGDAGDATIEPTESTVLLLQQILDEVKALRVAST